MTTALARAPESFCTPFAGAQHRTLPIDFAQLKMASAPRPNGGRLSARFNGGQRKITFSAKAEHDDCGNRLDEGPQESEYLVGRGRGRGFPDYERRVNVWWDAGRCPPPLDFDVSKIGSTVVEFLRRNFNTSRPIYLRVYGNLGELLPQMAKETVRNISESGFELAGFELKDDGGSNFISDLHKFSSTGMKKSLMTEDLMFYGFWKGSLPVPIHIVILDGKVITASALDQLVDRDTCCLICVEPEQESVDGVWCWKAARLNLPMRSFKASLGQCIINGGQNSSDLGGLLSNVNTFINNKIVSIWWDFERCPLPLNFNAPKIASNITKALHRLNLNGGPIYFHAYCNVQEIGEDIIRFLCESGFQIVGFRLDDCKRPDILFVEDLEFDFNLRSHFSRPSTINIVISDGCGYPYVSLDSLRENGNIIMPSNILLDEGPQGDGLPDDLFEEYGEHSDDENILKGGHFESKYLVERFRNFSNSVHIWWDVGRCPPPLNFDVSKIGITIVESLWHEVHPDRPIYLHLYGNLGELLRKMANDIIRIFSQSGLKLKGYELKDDSNVSNFILAGFQHKRKYFSKAFEENLMMDDLVYHCIINNPLMGPSHMVVLDGKVITTSTLNQHHVLLNECVIFPLVPEQKSVDGVWRWEIIRGLE